ncbi:MAG: hypothetical protein ACRCZP_03545, partial [Phycicoccus sp.]
PWDVLLLDVDNGPGFLVHTANAALYHPSTLAAARAALTPGGLLAVWSSHRAPDLLASLWAAAGPGDVVDEVSLPIVREGRELDYALYILERVRRP